MTAKRVNIAAVVGAGLCGVAMALSPAAVAGGYDCVETASGTAPAGAPVGAGGALCAPVTDMAGPVPMAFPGPPPVAPPPVVPPVAPPPVVPPVAPPPVVPPVVPPPAAPPIIPPPAAAPIVPAVAGVPVAPAAPVTTMGGYGGKGVVVETVPEGAPAPGEPILPGPNG